MLVLKAIYARLHELDGERTDLATTNLRKFSGGKRDILDDTVKLTSEKTRSDVQEEARTAKILKAHCDNAGNTALR